MGQVARHEPQQIVEDIKDSGRLKSLDEETHLAVVFLVVKDGSPKDDGHKVGLPGRLSRNLVHRW